MKTSRWLRTRLGAPDEVNSAFAGPPSLRLERRKELLVNLREEIGSHGFELAEVRTKRRVLAQGISATLARLERDEDRADRRAHWWTKIVVWRSSDGARVIVYRDHPDRSDFSLYGWGPASAPYFDAIDDLLTEGQP